MTLDKRHLNILHAAFPALSLSWIDSILENGELKLAQREELIVYKGYQAHCIFIISGIAISEEGNRTNLYSPGECIGLRETFFSASLPDVRELPYSGKSIKTVIQNPHGFKENVRVLSDKLEYISIPGNAILQSIASQSELREAWLYLLNEVYEREMRNGLELFHRNTTDRLREILEFIRKYADEKVSISVKHIQALTGISRSSMYRSLKELQENRELILCDNGIVRFQDCN
jgi:CRP-like cAMP-binding protein